jgi:ectoine hydroxylase-related dioxygenase (phytanoyl-CoA dioxygenase family)
MPTTQYLKNTLKDIIHSRSSIKDELPIFDKPEFLKKINKLQDTQLKNYALDFVNNGYVVVKNSVSHEDIDKAIEEFYSWKNRNQKNFLPVFYKEKDRLDRIVNIQSALPAFKALFYNNTSLELQDFLFQKKTSFYTSLFFEIGSSQDIHRDIPFFWTKPAYYYFGTWLALESTDKDNGPLVVLPGSHKIHPQNIDRASIAKMKYGDHDKIDPMDMELWYAYQSKIQDLCNQKSIEPQEVYVNKGDTIIWHPLLAHGGAQIMDPNRTRLSLVVHTTPHDVPVFHQDVFFNPKSKVRSNSGFTYENINNRHIPKNTTLNIGHHESFDFGSLK